MKKIIVLLMIQMLLTTPALALVSSSKIQNNMNTIQMPSAVDWWPMFCHDEARSGNTSSPAPDINHVKWNHTINDFIESSPSLVDGKAYVTTCNWWQGHIYCLDIYTGSFLWNYSISDQLFSSPAVSNGRVYVASLNGRMLCVNASTGQLIWNVLLDTDIMMQGSPVVSDEKVYISCTNEYPAVNRSKLFCLYAENGSVAWFSGTENARDISPAMVDGKLYGAGAGNILTCFDALTGEMIWQSTKQITTGNPVVVGNNVYGTSDTAVYCVSEGTTQWEFPLKTGFLVASSLAVGSGRVVVGALNPYASIPGMIHCINSATGAEYWNYSSVNNGEYNTKPTIAQNRLYVVEDIGVGLDRNARLCCHDLFTGELLTGQYVNPDTMNYVYGTPSMADGLLVIGSAEGDSSSTWGGIYCYGQLTVHEPSLSITNISGGKGLTFELENTGDADATGVTGEIFITGGLFIHQGTFVFPESIPAGETATVKVPLFGIGLGFLKGIPQISVNVTCAEQINATATQQFKLFLSRVTIVPGN
jgi:outer membrane protein assembly factor BamB